MKASDILLVDMPVGLAPRDAINDPDQVLGKITKSQLVSGEMVLSHNLADPTNISHDLAFVLGDELVMMAFPANDLMSQINLIQRGNAAMGRINEFLRRPAEPTPGDGGAQARSLPPPSPLHDPPLLAVRGLSFGYEGSGRGPVLRGVSFSVRKGEVVGLVGPTGGGKSTLLSVLLTRCPSSG